VLLQPRHVGHPSAVVVTEPPGNLRARTPRSVVLDRDGAWWVEVDVARAKGSPTAPYLAARFARTGGPATGRVRSQGRRSTSFLTVIGSVTLPLLVPAAAGADWGATKGTCCWQTVPRAGRVPAVR
jgi:hypothetical protein